MANNNSEYDRLRSAEQKQLLQSETASREAESLDLEKPKSEEEKGGTTETISKVKDLLSLKKRPKNIVPMVRDDVTRKVEKILEDGLGDAYSRLSPVAQQEFKLRGEEAAIKIRELLKDTHVKVKKIFIIILNWLKMLPGINKFFLEQEAKIKADKIIALHKK